MKLFVLLIFHKYSSIFFSTIYYVQIAFWNTEKPRQEYLKMRCTRFWRLVLRVSVLDFGETYIKWRKSGHKFMFGIKKDKNWYKQFAPLSFGYTSFNWKNTKFVFSLLNLNIVLTSHTFPTDTFIRKNTRGNFQTYFVALFTTFNTSCHQQIFIFLRISFIEWAPMQEIST